MKKTDVNKYFVSWSKLVHCQRIVTQGKHESNALSARLSGAVKVKRKETTWKVKRKDSQKRKKKKKTHRRIKGDIHAEQT